MKNLSSNALLAASLLFVGLGLGAATGCDGEVNDGDGGTCEAYPVCDSIEGEVASCDGLVDCHEVTLCGTTISCQSILPNCDAAPSCNSGDIEVEQCPQDDASCYVVNECDETLYCQQTEQCLAIPVCDEGDDELPDAECPQDAGCYELEMCGTTINCLDNGPAHGCPAELPTPGLTCGAEDEKLDCYYDVGKGCTDIYQCEESLWIWVGGGCEG